MAKRKLFKINRTVMKRSFYIFIYTRYYPYIVKYAPRDNNNSFGQYCNIVVPEGDTLYIGQYLIYYMMKKFQYIYNKTWISNEESSHHE